MNNKKEKFNFNNNTRMALRAAIAVVLCILITNKLELARGYWAVLTALSLMTASFGDSVYQSFIRFIMTIFGCFLGWGLFILFQHQPAALLAIAFLTVFITVYTLYHNFIVRMVVTGIAVVIIFSFLGSWDLELLWIRIYETLIGAGIAILVSGLVLPQFSKDELKKELHRIIEQIYELQEKIQAATRLNELETLRKELQLLEKDRLQIEQDYQFARFELMLQMKSIAYYRDLRSKVNMVCFYYQSLLNTKINAIKHPTDVRAYLSENAIEYYQERLDLEITGLKKIAKL